MRAMPQPADSAPVSQSVPETRPAAASPRKGGPVTRKSPKNPRYERLMELVEELRQQFPNASDEQILEWAKKRLEFESKQNDIWSGVANEYKVPMRRPADRSPGTEPEWKKYADQNNVPRTVGAKAPALPAPPSPQPEPEPPAYIPSGAAGVMVANPAYGKKHGMVFDGKVWQDGALQNQQLSSQQAEQEFIAQKRQMELEQLRMQMELDRLRAERDMSQMRKDPALAGLIGGAAKVDPVRPLGNNVNWMY